MKRWQERELRKLLGVTRSGFKLTVECSAPDLSDPLKFLDWVENEFAQQFKTVREKVKALLWAESSVEWKKL